MFNQRGTSILCWDTRIHSNLLWIEKIKMYRLIVKPLLCPLAVVEARASIDLIFKMTLSGSGSKCSRIIFSLDLWFTLSLQNMKTFILLSVLNWKKVINESNMDHRTKEFTYVYIIVDLPEPSSCFQMYSYSKGLHCKTCYSTRWQCIYFFFIRLFENIG